MRLEHLADRRAAWRQTIVEIVLNRHPLYLFEGDSSAGDTNGQAITAFGAAWYVMSPAGNAITTQSANTGGGGGGY